ncbi:hybrid sensor histidine kinase/response regulator [Variovorax sp. OV329]|uniref:hybrid sensor histidine kinase/response regulator n=1 Tax=Variovorax sp. OV329 TaxID=1882825 RepID=UPI0008E66DE5|nr:hybrid sensor histidine kinase/response regulator [Variovorax sp. OV329]SFM89794.1 Signal transduction histidine kinase [Variovorax sp. OV329]
MPTEVEAKLLIVDDLPENLLALEALVRGHGRPVFQARSAEEALGLMLTHEFALAILDVQMPGMNGFELAELMRGTERTRHIPIIFVSAAGRELNYAFTGYESGAVDFLQKPLDPHVVASKVNVFVELHRHKKALRREVEALAALHREQEALVQQLQSTQRELERAVRMRDDFMSMVSHELRTPLNTLYLETQVRKLHLSKGNTVHFGPDRLPAMIERDQRQIQSMVRLIDDMLDVTRLRSGSLTIQPKPMDLAALARHAVEMLSQQAEAAGCSVTLDAPEPVQGSWDEFRIEQVVTNLVTNALRYGGGQPVHIQVRRCQDWARISVRDQGMGIAPADQQRIFEQFERTEASRSKAAGLGLGLYITRQIVLSHGGEIEVRSQPGEGATFTVRLPLVATSIEPETPQAQRAQP